MRRVLFLCFLLLESINLFSQNNNRGSLAGIYVAQYAGANTQSYIFIFSAGSYTCKYEEFMDGVKSAHDISNVQVDESEKTVSFTDGKENEKGVVKFEDGETKLELESGPPTYTKINQTEPIKDNSLLKLTGIFKGEYSKMYGVGTTFYLVSFIGSKYTVDYSHSIHNKIDEKRKLKNVKVDEENKTIKWDKADQDDAGAGKFTNEGLEINGETFTK